MAVNLESRLKRLGFANGPMGGLQLAAAVASLAAVALFLVGAIALAFGTVFGAR